MAPVPCVDVDGLRGGGYPDEPEGRWYPGDSGYSDRYEEDRYRVPEPRHAEPEPHPLEARSGAVGPRSGVELPPLPTYEPDPMYQPLDPTGEHHTTPIDRSALRRPPEAPPPPAPGPGTGPVARPSGPVPGGSVYKARRAGAAAVAGAVAVVSEVLLLRGLIAGEFGHTVSPGAVLGSILAMIGIPVSTFGLYALITGPAATGGPEAVRAWLRTPLAYLPVGLVLLIAAALAIG